MFFDFNKIKRTRRVDVKILAKKNEKRKQYPSNIQQQPQQHNTFIKKLEK